MKENIDIQKALVVGLSRTGVAVCNFLVARGAAVVVSDTKPAAELDDVLSKIDPSVRVVAGEQGPSLLDEGFDAMVLSPGVPRSIPLVAEAYRRRIPVIAEVELAYRHMNGRVVAITGTDGKSTTTALAGHLFKELGMDVRVGGNIGVPLISFAGRTSDSTVVVAELSSFQLEAIERFRPGVAVLLNVTPDHLDRYDGMEDYFLAKMRIAMNQGGDDCFIYNMDDPMAVRGAGMVKSRAMAFSLESRRADIYYHEGAVVLADGGIKVFETDRMRVLGLHNVQNAMAAVLAARSIMLGSGIVPDYGRIGEAVCSFGGLEHRLEPMGTFRGREFINDSKATTVNAVLTALRSLRGSGVLILGGRTKGDDYSRLSAGMNGRVRALVLIGESREYFAKLFGNYGPVKAENLDDAVVKAMKESREGDAILLSPACASFDMFRNYEDRGEEFRKSFRRLQSGEI
ncbi:MAG: UDP-N-acetylmuramoyl-L-alanine--D-glutamate ligase [Spirochaetes bacterium]|nr:UDP-N-acetylmuramoyl-L-alanine--D-glutamate ligase [Spirochaetota bacterium]